MEEFVKKYIQEANELILSLEENTIRLEQEPQNLDLVNTIFRNFHTIKGGAAMFGFQNISEITHEIESVFDLIRNSKCKVNKQLIDKTFEIIDYIKFLLNNKNGIDKLEHLKKIQDLKDFKDCAIKNNSETTHTHNSTEIQNNSKTDIQEQSQSAEQNQLKTYRIFFKPNDDVFRMAIDPVSIVADISALGPSRVFAVDNFIPSIDQIVFDSCYTAWIAYVACPSEDKIKDIFIFVEDVAIIDIQKISDKNQFDDIGFVQNLDQIFQNDLNFFIQKYSLKKINNSDELTEKSTSNTNTNYYDAEIEKQTITQQYIQTTQTQSGATLTTLRIAAEKVDNLMNLISELISVQARLNNYSEQKQETELESIVENINKVSRQLRDTAFEMSMIPLQEIVVRFQRLIRDLSQQLGKEIEFVTSGTNTEIDKRIIENLVDPIMHLIRNSIDHGIEPASERQQLGKPTVGKVFLNAYYSGTYVYIQIGDDGRGIDTEKVKNIALQKGLLKQKPIYSADEIINVLFEPGFSTATKVSEISGRGVGLDVVRRKIAEIRGEVSVATELGRGTTFTIKLPLTLSIIDGLMVEVDKQKYILPVNIIRKIYQVTRKEMLQSFYDILVLDNEQIPFVSLRSQFGADDNGNEINHAIVITIDDKKYAIVVDKVVGEYQAVLKPLGKMFYKIQIFSGATILGDGTIALVVDLQKITSTTNKN